MINLIYSFDQKGCASFMGDESAAGHIGEHNATLLTLTVDPDFCPEASYYRLLFDNYASPELNPDTDGNIVYALPEALTDSGVLTFQLAGIRSAQGEVEIIAKSDTVTLELKCSLEGSSEPDGKTRNEMEGYIASSKLAVEEANAAADRAKLYKISAAEVDESGCLQLHYGDGTSVNAGSVKGPKGDPGEYTLPAASAAVLGGVKVGGGLAIESDGTLRTATLSSVSTYEVDTPAWQIQPRLINGDLSALRLWNEDYYFAHFTANPGEFILLELEGNIDSAVMDDTGNTLTFLFDSGSYAVASDSTLYDGCPVDVISLSAGPVLRYAGVSSVRHLPQLRRLYGTAPNIIEVTVTAGVFNQRFNAINLMADHGNTADTVEYQCDADGSNGVHIGKASTISRATLLIYDKPSFTKKFGSVRLHMRFDATGGNIWDATLEGMVRQSDDGSAPADTASAKANTFHKTVRQTGFIEPPTHNACEDIVSINYSSVRGKIDIRNGSIITVKEMKI